MPGYTYSISLRIWHPTRSLDYVTNELNLMPTAVWKAGEQRTAEKGKTPPIVRDTHFWTADLLKGSHAECDLADALSRILDHLASKKDLFLDISATGGRSELFVGWFFPEGNSGDVLGHELLSRFADLSIDISFDIYSVK